MPITIRTATMDDAEALRLYAERLFAEDLPGSYRRSAPTIEEERDFIRSHIEPERSTLILAEDDGEVVGLVDFVGNTMPEEAHGGVFGLSVDGARRGSGIGTALVEALLAWAPDHGICRIQAYAFATNPRAVALYERLGFEHEGRLIGAIRRDGEEIDVIALAKRL